jgi:predicted transcriptional regulator
LIVPAPPPHIPRANERTVLQKLTLTRGLSLEQLYPAGKQLIDSMVAKGWIEKQDDGRTYCRTPKGEAALKIILTLK